MASRAPKITFTSEADALAQVENFDTVKDMANEDTAAVTRLRDAFNAWFDAHPEPLTDEERGFGIERGQTPFGHDYTVRDMPNEMILFLAEHNALRVDNDTVKAFLETRELVDIGKFKHDKFRQTLVVTRAAAVEAATA